MHLCRRLSSQAVPRGPFPAASKAACAASVPAALMPASSWFSPWAGLGPWSVRGPCPRLEESGQISRPRPELAQKFLRTCWKLGTEPRGAGMRSGFLPPLISSKSGSQEQFSLHLGRPKRSPPSAQAQMLQGALGTLLLSPSGPFRSLSVS